MVGGVGVLEKLPVLLRHSGGARGHHRVQAARGQGGHDVGVVHLLGHHAQFADHVGGQAVIGAHAHALEVFKAFGGLFQIEVLAGPGHHVQHLVAALGQVLDPLGSHKAVHHFELLIVVNQKGNALKAQQGQIAHVLEASKFSHGGRTVFDGAHSFIGLDAQGATRVHRHDHLAFGHLGHALGEILGVHRVKFGGPPGHGNIQFGLGSQPRGGSEAD